MMHPAVRNIVASQLILLGALIICLLVLHDAQLVHDGLSYFTVQLRTLPIITLAFALSAYFMVTGAKQLPDHPSNVKTIAQLLPVFAVLMFGLILTPYSINSWFYAAHVTFGFSLFALQFIFAIWIWLNDRSPVMTFLALVLLMSGLISLTSLLSFVHIMLYGQILYEATFSLLLLKIVTQATTNPHRK